MSERIDVYIDKEKDYMYNALRNDANSIFYKAEMKDVYVAAATIAYHRHKSEKIKPGNRQGLVNVGPWEKTNTDQYWILMSIGIAQLGLDALRNPKEAMSLCQDYANAGIDILYNTHLASNEEQDFADYMFDVLEELDL